MYCTYKLCFDIILNVSNIQHNGVKFCYKANEVYYKSCMVLKATNKILKQITQSKLKFSHSEIEIYTKYWKQYWYLLTVLRL